MTYLPDVLYYDAPFNLYGIAFSHHPSHPNRVALTSFSSTSTNKLQIVEAPSTLSSSPSYSPSSQLPPGTTPDFDVLATTSIAFPPTKVSFEPIASSSSSRLQGGHSDPSGSQGGGKELIATAGDQLRIWEMTENTGNGGGSMMNVEDEESQRYGRGGYVGNVGWAPADGLGGRYEIKERSKLSNSKSPPTNLPPLTSFSWNPHSPQSIVTCSIDTTATVWDISTSTALTQLIAHDREVYDVSWLPQSSDVFVSVGADGSLRAFDLRSLEHSTILYETSDNRPLARIGFSQKEQHYLSTFAIGDEKALVLDMRSPGQPVVELQGHKGALGGVAWGCEDRAGVGGGGWVATCGDDSQLLIYDLTQPLPFPSSPASPSGGNSGRQSSKDPNNNSIHPPTSSASNSRSNATSRASTPATNLRTPARYPYMAWNSGTGEINNLAWGKEEVGAGKADKDKCWIGSVSGKRLTCLRF